MYTLSPQTGIQANSLRRETPPAAPPQAERADLPGQHFLDGTSRMNQLKVDERFECSKANVATTTPSNEPTHCPCGDTHNARGPGVPTHSKAALTTPVKARVDRSRSGSWASAPLPSATR